MTHTEVLNKLLKRMQEDGIATAAVKDGRILAISKTKLQELLLTVEKSNQDYLIVLIKSLEQMN